MSSDPKDHPWLRCASSIHQGDTVVLRFMLDALELFHARKVGLGEAGLFWALLSSRGYVGPRLRRLYEDSDFSAQRVFHTVYVEAITEMFARNKETYDGWA